MSDFIKIEKEDGSIEYINVDYDNLVANSVERNSEVPDDIASLSAEDLENLILESHKNFIRQERDRRLAESDWTQTNDSPLSNEKKTEWQTYRQELRDIISTITNVTDIVNWPTKP
jgi:hypothetical protein